MVVLSSGFYRFLLRIFVFYIVENSRFHTFFGTNRPSRDGRLQQNNPHRLGPSLPLLLPFRLLRLRFPLRLRCSFHPSSNLRLLRTSMDDLVRADVVFCVTFSPQRRCVAEIEKIAHLNAIFKQQPDKKKLTSSSITMAAIFLKLRREKQINQQSTKNGRSIATSTNDVTSIMATVETYQ